MVPRLPEFFRQGQAGVVSNSKNKILATWEPFFAGPCMSNNLHLTTQQILKQVFYLVFDVTLLARPVTFDDLIRNDPLTITRSHAIQLQGDPSGCSRGFVGNKTNDVFQFMLLMSKCNFCFDVNHN